ncbi:sensor histidine kinase [Mesohalobacter salilacus]|uniref:sensor histidine kinase n=1 Tax=Mesohalobacter salilacus TaxID=2491711 RepID=UPI00269CEDB7
MKFSFRHSLQLRIFLSMIALVILAAGLLVIVTSYHYKKEAEQLHQDKLERKESAIKSHIEYIKRVTTYPVKTENLHLIFRDKIYEIQDIHETSINIYDLKGNLLKSSKASFYKDSTETRIKDEILDSLANSSDKNYVKNFTENNQNFKSSYSYLLDNYFKPIGILNLAYVEDDEFMNKELEDFLNLLLTVNIIILIVAIVLALFLSKYITKSLSQISQKIKSTSLDKPNPKISFKKAGSELRPLITAYNDMIDELEDSAQKLAQTEREEAWQLMARQVAHEIKNPLTPMRLSVQSFQNQFKKKTLTKADIDEFGNTMIHQIDTLSTIATAFSDFAKMPVNENQIIEINDVLKLALDIFKGESISFKPSSNPIFVQIDKTQLIRIITNLIKNAIQATQEVDEAKITIDVKETENHAIIKVNDNGIGISEDIINRIFEPQFTTKNSGMGLGLSMVKKIINNHNGNIEVESKLNAYTSFTIILPKNK